MGFRGLIASEAGNLSKSGMNGGERALLNRWRSRRKQRGRREAKRLSMYTAQGDPSARRLGHVDSVPSQDTFVMRRNCPGPLSPRLLAFAFPLNRRKNASYLHAEGPKVSRVKVNPT